MRHIKNLCISEVGDYNPEKIISIGKKLNLSQAALTNIFNISSSTVQK
jgi:DNA-binding transcriptional regulator YiaG